MHCCKFPVPQALMSTQISFPRVFSTLFSPIIFSSPEPRGVKFLSQSTGSGPVKTLAHEEFDGVFADFFHLLIPSGSSLRTLSSSIAERHTSCRGRCSFSLLFRTPSFTVGKHFYFVESRFLYFSPPPVVTFPMSGLDFPFFLDI